MPFILLSILPGIYRSLWSILITEAEPKNAVQLFQHFNNFEAIWGRMYQAKKQKSVWKLKPEYPSIMELSSLERQ